MSHGEKCHMFKFSCCCWRIIWFTKVKYGQLNKGIYLHCPFHIDLSPNNKIDSTIYNTHTLILKLWKSEPNIVLIIWSWECGSDDFHSTCREWYSDVFAQILPHHPNKLSVSYVPVPLVSGSFVRLPVLAPVLQPGCLKDPDVQADCIEAGMVDYTACRITVVGRPHTLELVKDLLDFLAAHALRISGHWLTVATAAPGYETYICILVYNSCS